MNIFALGVAKERHICGECIRNLISDGMKIMRCMSPITRTILCCFAVIQSANSFAAGQASTEKCEISVIENKEGTTWTLSNDRIVRKLIYEKEKFAFHTLSFRDKVSGVEFLSPGNNLTEGSIDFVSTGATSAVPVPAADWKFIEVQPSGEWFSEKYDDTGWKSISLPFRTEEGNKSWWFRKKIDVPKDYSDNLQIVFSSAVDDGAEVYINGKLIGKIDTASEPWAKTIAFDIPGSTIKPGEKAVIAIKLNGFGAPNGLLESISISKLESTPIHMEFGKGARLLGQKVIDNGGMGRQLRLRFQGSGEASEIEYVMDYFVYPGAHPWMSKRVTVRNAGAGRFMIRNWFAEKLGLSLEKGGTLHQNQKAAVVAGKEWGDGLFCTLSHPHAQILLDSGELGLKDGREVSLLPGEAVEGSLSTLGVYRGSVDTGFWTYRLFLTYDFARCSPRRVPVMYNTWYGYMGGIDQAICEKLVPLAAKLGCGGFVIDDGWQKCYGDWFPDTAKFPRGLGYIKELCARNGMKFGLWAAPIAVRPASTEKEKFMDCLRIGEDGKPVSDWIEVKMCTAANPWNSYFSRRMADLTGELKLDFMKLDFLYLGENCFSGKHDHPAGKAVPYVVDNWYRMMSEIRAANPDMVLDSVQGSSEVLDTSDENWFGDWIIFELEGKFDKVDNWYLNADDYRRVMWERLATYPGSAVAKETTCHIAGGSDALFEYHTTSVAAYACNVEVHGKLDEMTPREEEILGRWLKWNWENRDFLQFSQPILGKPYSPAHQKRSADGVPCIDGVAHLRNLCNGKYGYLCMWNPKTEDGIAELNVNPSEWYISMDFGKLEIISLRDGSKVKWSTKDGHLLLDREMKARSWDILELRSADDKGNGPGFFEFNKGK